MSFEIITKSSYADMNLKILNEANLNKFNMLYGVNFIV